jgi:hypothetical protein
VWACLVARTTSGILLHRAILSSSSKNSITLSNGKLNGSSCHVPYEFLCCCAICSTVASALLRSSVAFYSISLISNKAAAGAELASCCLSYELLAFARSVIGNAAPHLLQELAPLPVQPCARINTPRLSVQAAECLISIALIVSVVHGAFRSRVTHHEAV